MKLLLGEAVYEENKQYLISDKLTKLMIGSEPVLTILTFLAFSFLTITALWCSYAGYLLLLSIGPNLKDMSVLNVIFTITICIGFVIVSAICAIYAIKSYERNAIRYGKYTVILTKAIILGLTMYFLKETPLIEPLKMVVGL